MNDGGVRRAAPDSPRGGFIVRRDASHRCHALLLNARCTRKRLRAVRDLFVRFDGQPNVGQPRCDRLRAVTHRQRRLSVAVAGMLVASSLVVGVQTQQVPTMTRTRVVLLGTGTPRPLPTRFGPSTAIVVDDTVKGLAATRLETTFVTHLHSDHTVGYPDLILTPWVMGRSRLRVYGPKGRDDRTRVGCLAD
jgi:hypothetical protein